MRSTGSAARWLSRSASFPKRSRRFDGAISAPTGPADACHICLPLALGYAFDRAGRPDSAIAMFEQYVNRPYSLRLSHQIDPVNLARVLRRLGELHDSLGNREKARDNYSRFVDLWEKADPELQPQVKAVRRRLVELSAEPVGPGLSPPLRKP